MKISRGYMQPQNSEALQVATLWCQLPHPRIYAGIGIGYGLLKMEVEVGEESWELRRDTGYRSCPAQLITQRLVLSSAFPRTLELPPSLPVPLNYRIRSVFIALLRTQAEVMTNHLFLAFT